MTAIELKTLLIHKISEINDISFLKALKTILDSKTDTEVIQLTQEQLDEIIASKKGIKRVSADVGFMFIAYNLRRIGNILTHDLLREYLRILVLLFLGKKDHPGLKKSLLRPSLFRVPVWAVKWEWAQVSA